MKEALIITQRTIKVDNPVLKKPRKGSKLWCYLHSYSKERGKPYDKDLEKYLKKYETKTPTKKKP